MDEDISPFLPKSYDWYEEEKEEKLAFLGDTEKEALPIFDEQDKEILLHRDVHFGGSFGAMLEYYSNEDAKGVIEDISPARIAFLEQIQKLHGKNLAPLLLSGSDAEKVGKARSLYKKLQAIAESSQKTPESILAECIVSEDDIDDIVQNTPAMLLEKPEILVPLISSEDFFDVLSPGYGTAPLLAIELLGKARYSKAIQPLFQLIGCVDDYIESAVLSALSAIGEEAKQFGLKILQGRPITKDTERAALMLTYFVPDPTIEAAFKTQLRDHLVKGSLRDYLLIGIN
jgi:hypothetical protein